MKIGFLWKNKEARAKEEYPTIDLDERRRGVLPGEVFVPGSVAQYKMVYPDELIEVTEPAILVWHHKMKENGGEKVEEGECNT